MRRRGFIAIAAIAATAAMPLAASAHHKPDHSHGPPPWAGGPGGPNAVVAVDPAVPAIVPETGPDAGAGALDVAAPQLVPAEKPSDVPARCRKAQKVGFAVTGEFGEYVEPDLAITVIEANKHARKYIEANGSSFDATGVEASFEGVEDADASGTIGYEDAQAGDLVELGGKLLRPKRRCEGETALRVDRISVIRPAPEPVEVTTTD